MSERTVDLSVDPRAERIRKRLTVFAEAIQELIDFAEGVPLIDTKYAKILRHYFPKHRLKKIENMTSEKLELFLGLRNSGYPKNDNTGIVVREQEDGQLDLIDGTNRAAFLMLFGRPIIAVEEPKFEDLFK